MSGPGTGFDADSAPRLRPLCYPGRWPATSVLLTATVAYWVERCSPERRRAAAEILARPGRAAGAEFGGGLVDSRGSRPVRYADAWRDPRPANPDAAASDYHKAADV